MTFRVMTSRRGPGERRPVLLYRVWRDMISRVKGYATKCPHKYAGLPVAWGSYREFRAWALSHGFSKENCSPDRRNAFLGYEPGNVRFVPKRTNALRALYDDSDEAVRGREPPMGDDGAL